MAAGRSPGRTALVTGAGRGLGAAIATRFRDAGYAVLTPARTELDLARPASIEEYASSGGLAEVDVLVNNAAENRVALLGELDLADWNRMLQIDLTAPFELIRRTAGAMAARRWGRIVNIGSAYGIVSRAGRGGYSAAKSGLNGLTRTAALEYAGGGVLVNTVCPGFADTEMTRQNNTPEAIADICSKIPLGRLARPEEIAEIVFFLGSEHNTYITGQTIPVDGGFLCR